MRPPGGTHTQDLNLVVLLRASGKFLSGPLCGSPPSPPLAFLLRFALRWVFLGPRTFPRLPSGASSTKLSAYLSGGYRVRGGLLRKGHIPLMCITMKGRLGRWACLYSLGQKTRTGDSRFPLMARRGPCTRSKRNMEGVYRPTGKTRLSRPPDPGTASSLGPDTTTNRQSAPSRWFPSGDSGDTSSWLPAR